MAIEPTSRNKPLTMTSSDSGDLSGEAKKVSSRPLPTATIIGLLLAAVLVILLSIRVEEKTALLWQIGKPDHDNREFALAAKDYARYKEDGLFVVGQSDSRTDWPYVHPGPGDDFGGRQPHTFSIWFGVKNPKAAGSCKLKFRLLDRARVNPPRLRVEINGRGHENILPPGAGDPSINGRPEQGRPYQFEIPFEAGRLQTGDNVIRITTVSGSWLLYDWIGLEAPPSIQSIPVANRTWIKACPTPARPPGAERPILAADPPSGPALRESPGDHHPGGGKRTPAGAVPEGIRNGGSAGDGRQSGNEVAGGYRIRRAAFRHGRGDPETGPAL